MWRATMSASASAVCPSRICCKPPEACLAAWNDFCCKLATAWLRCVTCCSSSLNSVFTQKIPCFSKSRIGSYRTSCWQFQLTGRLPTGLSFREPERACAALCRHFCIWTTVVAYTSWLTGASALLSVLLSGRHPCSNTCGRYARVHSNA